MASEEVQMELDSARWAQLQALLARATPFGNETGRLPNGEFEPSPEVRYQSRECGQASVGTHSESHCVLGSTRLSPTAAGARSDWPKQVFARIQEAKILVVGAGGLGCEVSCESSTW
jgi:hypothetical protein